MTAKYAGICTAQILKFIFYALQKSHSFLKFKWIMVCKMLNSMSKNHTNRDCSVILVCMKCRLKWQMQLTNRLFDSVRACHTLAPVMCLNMRLFAVNFGVCVIKWSTSVAAKFFYGVGYERISASSKTLPKPIEWQIKRRKIFSYTHEHIKWLV